MSAIIPLKIKYEYENRPYFLYPTVIKGKKKHILVNLGYPGSLPLIEEALRQEGIEPKTIRTVYFTHHHDEAIGAAAEWKKKYWRTKFMTSIEEAPFIDGRQKPFKVEQAEQLLEAAEDELQEQTAAQYMVALASIPPVKIHRTVADGNRLPVETVAEVIATPGQTVGHTSIYCPEENIVIAGEAAAKEKSYITIGDMNTALDLKEASESLEKIIRLDPEMIICYKTGIFAKSEETEYTEQD